MAIGLQTSQARSLRSDRARAKAWSLRSDRARIRLGRYIATELKPKLGRYVATKHAHSSLAMRLSRYLATELEPNSVATYRPRTYTAWLLCSDRALPKRQYDTNLCILVYSLNAISRRPRLSYSMFPVTRSHQSNFTIKTAGSLLLSKKP
ncbi:hypothetical protein F2Q69_00033384 [Brassica cretica]|uniref:Uncharacterized protein n=1 Tax=Brassica cretica TaxID=69181 RepID=A0A8S9SN80_BRACR|nr:hypothetical protein F2Q69_00033384 [Brassica cretica]